MSDDKRITKEDLDSIRINDREPKVIRTHRIDEPDYEAPAINEAAARHLLGQIRMDSVLALQELEEGSLTVAKRLLTGMSKLKYVLRMNEANAKYADKADEYMAPVVSGVSAEELRRSRA